MWQADWRIKEVLNWH